MKIATAEPTSNKVPSILFAVTTERALIIAADAPLEHHTNQAV